MKPIAGAKKLAIKAEGLRSTAIPSVSGSRIRVFRSNKGVITMQYCYCCSDTARQAVYLTKRWMPVCRAHASEAVTEEPSIAVCEIEDLEGMKNERQSEVA